MNNDILLKKLITNRGKKPTHFIFKSTNNLLKKQLEYNQNPHTTIAYSSTSNPRLICASIYEMWKIIAIICIIASSTLILITSVTNVVTIIATFYSSTLLLKIITLIMPDNKYIVFDRETGTTTIPQSFKKDSGTVAIRTTSYSMDPSVRGDDKDTRN